MRRVILLVALALVATALVVPGCSSMNKNKIEERLLAMEGNAPVRALGLTRRLDMSNQAPQLQGARFDARLKAAPVLNQLGSLIVVLSVHEKQEVSEPHAQQRRATERDNRHERRRGHQLLPKVQEIACRGRERHERGQQRAPLQHRRQNDGRKRKERKRWKQVRVCEPRQKRQRQPQHGEDPGARGEA